MTSVVCKSICQLFFTVLSMSSMVRRRNRTDARNCGARRGSRPPGTGRQKRRAARPFHEPRGRKRPGEHFPRTMLPVILHSLRKPRKQIISFAQRRRPPWRLFFYPPVGIHWAFPCAARHLAAFAKCICARPMQQSPSSRIQACAPGQSN